MSGLEWLALALAAGAGIYLFYALLRAEEV